MKKVVRLFGWIFLLLISGQVNAQVWFQEGDKWIYQYSCCWGFKRGYEEVWVNGDTIINGQTCKILNNQVVTVQIAPEPSNDTLISFGDSYFVYEQSDSVFLYNESDETFQLIYDFSIDEYLNQTYAIDGCPNNSGIEQTLYFMLFDSTNLQTGGQNRRVQNLFNFDINNTGLQEHFISIVEGIGIVSNPSIGNPIPLSGENFGYIISHFAYPCPDETNRTFCSFTSNGEEYNPENKDCYQLPMPVATNNLIIQSINFDLYPNPANTHFSIQNSQNLPIKKITVFNTKGSLQKVVNQPAKDIDISDLSKGIYIVEIEFNHSLVYKKLIKQ